MNKNRGFTPLAVVLMLSGSLALTADARRWRSNSQN